MQTIGNRYEIQRELGAGGMGTVYLAIDKQTEASIAVKQLKREIAQPEMLERFKREGQALRELNHPNIVKLLDTIEDSGEHYLILEYVAGGDLRDLLEKGKLPFQRCLNIAIDLADALTRAHRLNIIHRDLKPANVLVAEDGTIRLTDFGVPYVVDKARVTQTDAIVGTLDYLPPEAINGEPIDTRSDIWAFGVMLFEMLAGSRPFSANGYIPTMHAIATAPVPDLEKLAPDVPPALVDLVYRMLTRDPQARISSVRHVGAALEDILQGRENKASRFETPILDFRQRPKHNLPSQSSPFVGREAELSELSDLINSPNIRLISLIAQGGMGKTRLSLEAAERQIPNFEHGVYLVELAPLHEVDSILPTIANSLNYQFQEDGREPKQQILDFLQTKELLLVLDNFEHLLEGTAIISDILQAAPHVKVLASSREKLNLSGETVYALRGMQFPTWETPADALRYDAVQLLQQAAKRIKPDWEVNAANLHIVARICRLTEGMPLGILLAVAWLDVLTLEEIAEEIQKSVDFLETKMRDVPERQRSIRAIFEAAWKRLEPLEQEVFMKMAVFRGGCTRQAAQAVTGANLRVLQNLVNKALLIRGKDERFDIHELLRQYAEMELNKTGQAEPSHQAHAAYYAVAMQQRESWLHGGNQLEALRDIDSDFENVRATWHWAIAARDWQMLDRMLESFHCFTLIRGRIQESKLLLKMTAEQLSDADSSQVNLWARVVIRWYGLYYQEDSSFDMVTNLQTALEILREAHNDIEISFCLRILAMRIDKLGQLERAWDLAQEALAIARAKHDHHSEVDTLYFLGYLVGARMDKFDEATQYQWLEAIEIARQSKDIFETAGLLMNYGVFAHMQKNFDLAQSYLKESLSLQRTLGSSGAMQLTLMNLSQFSAEQGYFEAAETYGREALELAQYRNDRPSMVAALSNLASNGISQGDYGGSLELSEDALKLVEGSEDPNAAAGVNINRGVALCGLGDYRQAAQLLYPALAKIAASSQNLMLVVHIHGIALVLAHYQDLPERALELASLIAHHPAATFWENAPLAKSLLAHLQTVLAPEVYAAAWERGKSMDLRATTKQILEEFAPKP